ncbi:hypothetical protein [Candidatus Binatus sp.]|uniref:hypothetical protein n=1 Tax=Candidatus Binatus sp. TaxID=2811406 RepID=UPI003BB146F2
MLSDAFMSVGSPNTAREATATAVVLPNGKTLIAGGSHCAAKTYGPGGLCGGSSFSGFQCDALNTAELYSEGTELYTLAGAGSGGVMTTARSGATGTLITGSGTSLDGELLITGGSTCSTRGGYGFGILNAGSNSGDLVVIGGECAVGSLSSAAIGSAEAGTLCGTAAQTDYYELFNPSTGTWMVGTAATPPTPANSPTSALLP